MILWKSQTKLQRKVWFKNSSIIPIEEMESNQVSDSSNHNTWQFFEEIKLNDLTDQTKIRQKIDEFTSKSEFDQNISNFDAEINHFRLDKIFEDDYEKIKSNTAIEKIAQVLL